MATLKCKMCGGDLILIDGENIAECEYCGSKQTVPTVDDDKKQKLYDRANKLRFNCDFDKAASVFENIVNEFPDDAESYWGLILCKYGIEYVDDPATGKKIPTCHRSSFDSVMDDPDFDMVMENAEGDARALYRQEAKQIEELRRGILEVSGREQPYDIFICYKETDDDGQRTIDSVIAQDVYEALTDKGYRVFFSRISLEDKLGTEYEPYIFAALNSARLMLAFGTSYDYYNAAWVKNEWSRFLKLMASDKEKYLIPCYKDIDAYDIPKEFAKFQAQDMGKVGAMQDLMRGIDKIFGKDKALDDITASAQQVINPQVQAGGLNAGTLIARGNMALEDEAFEEAGDYFNRVLDIDMKAADAYLGLFMVDIAAKNRAEAKNKFIAGNYISNRYWNRAKQFAGETLQAELQDWETEQNVRFQRDAEIERRKKEEDERKQQELREKKEEIQIRVNERREKIKKCEKVLLASWCNTVALKKDGTVVVAGDSKDYSLLSYWKDIVSIAVSSNINTEDEFIVGLKANGTAVATGCSTFGQCAVFAWENIVSIATGWYHTVGLQTDGKVVATGRNDDLQCYVSTWTDIISISAGALHTVGLRKDGTVVAAGTSEACKVSSWKNVVSITASILHTVGLKSDGTVVATGNNERGQCNVSEWTDVISISAGDAHTVGLRKDGTVVAVGTNDDGRCDVSDWTDIIAVSAGNSFTIGLKTDGTVVATGNNRAGQCDVSSWKDIVWITAGLTHTVGLKADGTVVATGDNTNGKCDVSGWKLFDNYERIDEERIEALLSEKEMLQNELSNLRGLFSGRRRTEIEERLSVIEKRLLKENRP